MDPAEKFEEIYSWLIEAAKERNINLKKLPNDQLDSIIPADPENINWRERPEFVLFWDKDVNLARMLEREGFRVFNNADGIEACSAMVAETWYGMAVPADKGAKKNVENIINAKKVENRHFFKNIVNN